MERCPVCGMTVERTDTAPKAQHQGNTYYFCSTACQREFESNPQQYTQREAGR